MFKSQKIGLIISTLMTNLFVISYVFLATNLSLLAKILISLTPIIGSAIGFPAFYFKDRKEE